MKNIFCLMLVVFTIGSISAQTNIVGGGGQCKVDGDPDLHATLDEAGLRDCWLAVNSSNGDVYLFNPSDPVGDRWDLLVVGGGGTPINVTPGSGGPTTTGSENEGDIYVDITDPLNPAAYVWDADTSNWVLMGKPDDHLGTDDQLLTGARTTDFDTHVYNWDLSGVPRDQFAHTVIGLDGLVQGWYIADAAGELSWVANTIASTDESVMIQHDLGNRVLLATPIDTLVLQGRRIQLDPIELITDNTNLKLLSRDPITKELEEFDVNSISSGNDQTLSLSDEDLTISDGNTVDLSVLSNCRYDLTLSAHGLAIADLQPVWFLSGSFVLDAGVGGDTIPAIGSVVSIIDANTLSIQRCGFIDNTFSTASGFYYNAPSSISTSPGTCEIPALEATPTVIKFNHNNAYCGGASGDSGSFLVVKTANTEGDTTYTLTHVTESGTSYVSDISPDFTPLRSSATGQKSNDNTERVYTLGELAIGTASTSVSAKIRVDNNDASQYTFWMNGGYSVANIFFNNTNATGRGISGQSLGTAITMTSVNSRAFEFNRGDGSGSALNDLGRFAGRLSGNASDGFGANVFYNLDNALSTETTAVQHFFQWDDVANEYARYHIGSKGSGTVPQDPHLEVIGFMPTSGDRGVSVYDRLGILTDDATSNIDVNGANGYDQLRLRTSYTPTGSADANGTQGDIAWDDDFIYVKTSTGWKRSALTTF